MHHLIPLRLLATSHSLPTPDIICAIHLYDRCICGASGGRLPVRLRWARDGCGRVGSGTGCRHTARLPKPGVVCRKCQAQISEPLHLRFQIAHPAIEVLRRIEPVADTKMTRGRGHQLHQGTGRRDTVEIVIRRGTHHGMHQIRVHTMADSDAGDKSVELPCACTLPVGRSISCCSQAAKPTDAASPPGRRSPPACAGSALYVWPSDRCGLSTPAPCYMYLRFLIVVCSCSSVRPAYSRPAPPYPASRGSGALRFSASEPLPRMCQACTPASSSCLFSSAANSRQYCS